jgi:bifunctional UDP-N-acetylglucosamine pyrophosphorylase/glucosamine-1-phosphate N-acetyltransferase
VSAVHPAAVIVLAAGEGKRMKSATPKVLHTLCGRTMLGHVVAVSRELEPEHLVVVVGHGREQVTAHLAEIDPAARAVVQAEQHGTGHAVRVALDALCSAVGELDGVVVVDYGDGPMLTAATLRELVAEHVRAGYAVTALSAGFDDPTGYGRIVRDADGAVTDIVEQKDASLEQLRINEGSSGVFAFDAKLLREALTRLSRNNANGEEYLTDVLGIVGADGHAVGAYLVGDPRDVLAANDRAQFAELRRRFNDRLLEHWMREGVTVVDPASTWLDVQVELAPDVVLHPNTQLHGATRVAEGAEVGPSSTLTDTVVGPRARVRYAVCEGAEIGERVAVGPYTYLRPGTRLARGSKAGGFVEMKNAVVGEGSKVPHLSYVGDAEIGAGSNLGAGTITANYDGVAKHRTVIGDHVFVGSDTVLIAPAQVDDGAYVAAGSAVTEPVPPGVLGVARGRQRNVEGWVERSRPGTESARAAEAARAAETADTDTGRTDTADAGHADAERADAEHPGAHDTGIGRPDVGTSGR